MACSKAKGTFPRHVDLNHTIHRALISASHRSSLEPLGLSRDDGKRPEGLLVDGSGTHGLSCSKAKRNISLSTIPFIER